MNEDKYWSFVDETFDKWEKEFREVAELEGDELADEVGEVREALYKELMDGQSVELEIIPTDTEYIFWSKEDYERIMD